LLTSSVEIAAVAVDVTKIALAIELAAAITVWLKENFVIEKNRLIGT
jgi:hypothetical protein